MGMSVQGVCRACASVAGGCVHAQSRGPVTGLSQTLGLRGGGPCDRSLRLSGPWGLRSGASCSLLQNINSGTRMAPRGEPPPCCLPPAWASPAGLPQAATSRLIFQAPPTLSWHLWGPALVQWEL